MPVSWLRRKKSLVYEVPEEQDPAAIVAALRQDGLEAIEVSRQGRQRVVISGAGRSRVRALIARIAGPKVTFVDE